jgi:DNA repair protein RecN (Recombination protein N)
MPAMLRRLALRDFAIVTVLEVEFDAGFTVLTGETGAGKSILVDALQLALGARADATVVREGAPRSDISAEFDTPPALAGWLEAGGFEAGDTLLLRRVVDVQGKSRAWINGSPATVTQLREAADALVDIHGQHAWQSLTRPAAVRAMLDARAGVDTAALAQAHARWRAAEQALEHARAQREAVERERERLAWQIGELGKLAPGHDEWEALNAEHQRLAHAQALLEAARDALDALAEADTSASRLAGRAASRLDDVARFDERLTGVIDVVRSAQVQLDDAAHTLAGYLHQAEPQPSRMAELDARLGAWMALARRWRRPPAELPALLAQWRVELQALDASVDIEALARALDAARTEFDTLARSATAMRQRATQPLADEVTKTMQVLGMSGGCFEVALQPHDEPQPHGHESVELRVAGHAGSTPRALSKVASGGELSRIALAISVATSQSSATPTLIFDEVDVGIGGTVAHSVGRLLKQLGRTAQVLAVTHLPQVAACADHHFVVSKSATGDGPATSAVRPARGEARVGEVARMLGGEGLATSLAHARQLLAQRGEDAADPRQAAPGAERPSGKARAAGRRKPQAA